jgi:hypothetical protein
MQPEDLAEMVTYARSVCPHRRSHRHQHPANAKVLLTKDAGAVQGVHNLALRVCSCNCTLNTESAFLVGLGRFELPTNGLGNRCSIHLSYSPTTPL